MKELRNGTYTGERALFASHALAISDAVFEDGESPLKESADLHLERTTFRWKYPLWYCRRVEAVDCLLETTARSGIWYTHDISMRACRIDAPKIFRRASGIRLEDVSFSNAQETMWNCSDISLKRVSIRGDYFGMGSCGVRADGLDVEGNYIFDGGSDIVVENSRLISKDAFWNCTDVVVKNCYIEGEYLGWNSKNVTFIDCTIESNQGLCYMENVKLVNCKLVRTDLAFEYSTVDADIRSSVDSVKNPGGGRIVADRIDELIMESECVDVSATQIICRDEARRAEV